MHDQLLQHTDSEIIVTADVYDDATKEGSWDSPERAQRLVEKYVGEGSVVLDVGIGTGQAVRGYAEKGATVVGFDHDQEMLEAARIVTGQSGYLQQADINGTLPFEGLKGKIDVAQSIGVLEFANDLGSVIDQVKTTLKPDGVFVFTVETIAGEAKLIEEFPDAGITVHRHSTEEVKGLLESKGFKLLYDEAYGGYERGDITSGKVPYQIFLAKNRPVVTN